MDNIPSYKLDGAFGDTASSSNPLNIEYYLNQLPNQFIDIINRIDFVAINHVANIVLSILAVIFIFIIAYSFIRMFEVRAKEKEHLQEEIEEYAHHHAHKENALHDGAIGFKNEKWNQVLQYLFSESAGDWKLAVIEADSMLETLLEQLSFKGDNLGEKLKAADRDSFRNLSAAWEVHTIRNRIAHEGSDFNLSLREAKRVISLYEQIFREFDFI